MKNGQEIAEDVAGGAPAAIDESGELEGAPKRPVRHQPVVRTLYERATGHITGRFRASHPLSSGAHHLTGEIEGEFPPETHYVDITADPPVVRERQALAIMADRLAIVAGPDAPGVVFSHIPRRVSVSIDGGTPIEIEESQSEWNGVVDFAANHPGTYTITFSGTAFLPQTFAVVAT